MLVLQLVCMCPPQTPPPHPYVALTLALPLSNPTPQTLDLKHMRRALEAAPPMSVRPSSSPAPSASPSSPAAVPPSSGAALLDEDVLAEAEAVHSLCRDLCSGMAVVRSKCGADAEPGGSVKEEWLQGVEDGAGCLEGGELEEEEEEGGAGGKVPRRGVEGLPGVHLFGLRKEFPGWDGWLGGLARQCWEGVTCSSGAEEEDPAAASSTGNRAEGAAGQQHGAVGGGGRGGGKGSGGRGGGPHVAVVGTWLSLKEGQCFCLLGPNGAGKTTSIKCLIGAMRPSSGDALIYGHSILSPGGMDSARSLMGVCPQFDVLWPELTGLEHMLVYADIKGLPWESRKAAAAQILDRVGLGGSGGRGAGWETR